ncbi:hypothetical protein RI367_001974 [Sorochytrium milnesiophthora]
MSSSTITRVHPLLHAERQALQIRREVRDTPPPPPPGVAFVGGAAGLSLAFAVMHPLDTLKTLIQAHPGARRMPQWRALGKGFWSSVGGAAPQGGLRFAAYEWTRQQCGTANADLAQRHSMVVTLVSAVVGDLASSVVKVPREVITARLQTQQHGGHDTWSSIVRQILRDDGVAGMWRGFGTILARDAPFMMILLSSYEGLKRRQSPSSSPAMLMVLGGLSGAVAGFLTTPCDVLRTQQLTAATRYPTASGSAGGSSSGGGVISSLKRMHQTQGGLRALYRGSLARGASWFGICSVFFPVYEVVVGRLMT